MNNPHETYTLDAEDLILELDRAKLLPDDALATLNGAGGVDMAAVLQQPLSLSAGGADDAALRLSRLLTSPGLASARQPGEQAVGSVPLDAAGEATAKRALAAVAEARLAALPTPESQEDGSFVGILLSGFVAEKRRVLRLSADALSR